MAHKKMGFMKVKGEILCWIRCLILIGLANQVNHMGLLIAGLNDSIVGWWWNESQEEEVVKTRK